MQGIAISALELIGENGFGKTMRIDLNERPEGLLAFRKAGSVSGSHYHKGHSQGKNPERLALLSGVVQLSCRNLDTHENARYHLRAPVKIDIHPHVWHELKALTDIIFLELNSLEEHSADTFRL